MTAIEERTAFPYPEGPPDSVGEHVPQPVALDRRMRVLFCTWNYFPVPTGGAERQARLQAEELVRRGHDVTVICPQMSKAKSGFIEGVEVHRLPKIHGRPGQRLSYLASVLAYLLRRIRGFDLVHVHLANLQIDVIVPLALLVRRPVYAKVACGGHAGEVNRLRKPAVLTRWFGLRHATRVQALSEEIVGELEGIGVRPDRIVRIPNGIDLEGFRPGSEFERLQLRDRLDLPRVGTIFLFVGRFARYKGILDLLDVWPRVASADAHLVLVGSTTETDQPIGELALPPGVHVREYTNSVVDYLRAADVFVYPSYADGMSNALLEAMACGLAVVATSSGATAELIESGRQGMLVPAGDLHALERALVRLRDDEALRKGFGKAAREALQPYAIRTVVDAIEAEYLRMIGALA